MVSQNSSSQTVLQKAGRTILSTGLAGQSSRCCKIRLYHASKSTVAPAPRLCFHLNPHPFAVTVVPIATSMQLALPQLRPKGDFVFCCVYIMRTLYWSCTGNYRYGRMMKNVQLLDLSSLAAMQHLGLSWALLLSLQALAQGRGCVSQVLAKYS